MSQHRRPTAFSPARAGALRTAHARQQRWPGPARVAWWVLLLPVAVAAWASCRHHVGARVAGYVLAGYVLLVGVVACTGTVAAPAPVAATAPVPVVTTTAAPVAPAAVPLVAPPSPSVSVVVPAPETTTVAPAPSPYVPELGSTSSSTSGTGGDYSSPSTASSGTGYGDSYINSDGNQVESPDANSSGASARCKDGTFSHSQHSRGTCSHHGGVAR